MKLAGSLRVFGCLRDCVDDKCVRGLAGEFGGCGYSGFQIVVNGRPNRLSPAA